MIHKGQTVEFAALLNRSRTVEGRRLVEKLCLAMFRISYSDKYVMFHDPSGYGDVACPGRDAYLFVSIHRSGKLFHRFLVGGDTPNPDPVEYKNEYFSGVIDWFSTRKSDWKDYARLLEKIEESVLSHAVMAS